MEYFKFKITNTYPRINNYEEKADKENVINYIGFCFLFKEKLYISQLTFSDEMQHVYLVDTEKIKKYKNVTIKQFFESLKAKRNEISNRWGILDDYFVFYKKHCNLIDFLNKNEIDIPEKKELRRDIESIKLSKELNIDINFTSKFGLTR